MKSEKKTPTKKNQPRKPFVITRKSTADMLYTSKHTKNGYYTLRYLVVHNPVAGRDNVYTVYRIPDYERGHCCESFPIVGRELDLKTIREIKQFIK